MMLKLEKRPQVAPGLKAAAPAASVLLALVVVAIPIAASGADPLEVYRMMLWGAFGSRYGAAETVVKAIPLLICALAVSIPMHMELWNIGGDGQFFIGAIAACWLALFHPDLPPYIMLPGMLLLAAAAGGLWAALAAIPRARWGVDEVITTLLLNHVAFLWVNYLAYGPWKDPHGNQANPFTAILVPNAQLATFGTTRIHVGLLFGLLAAVVLAVALSRTSWGYELRVIGQSVSAGRYAGMRVGRSLVLVMVLSGALAGVAGTAEISGVVHRLQADSVAGYGYSGLIIARLAGMHPLIMVLVSGLFGALIVGSYSMQTAGMSAQIGSVLQGTILFFVLLSEFYIRYRIRRVAPATTLVSRLPGAEGSK